jgi:hypothetical protein
MATKVELEQQLQEKDAALRGIRSEIGAIAADLHAAQQQAAEFKERAEVAEEALAQRTAVSTQEGQCVEIGTTLVLAETEALTHWSNKASATWAVDFEGDTEKAGWACKAVATSREPIEELPDGSWRMHCSNRNAAMRMEKLGRDRIAAEVKRTGQPIAVTVEAVPTRSMAIAARDAARATGVGRFALGSFPTISFLGPVQVYVRDNGEVLIRPKP